MNQICKISPVLSKWLNKVMKLPECSAGLVRYHLEENEFIFFCGRWARLYLKRTRSMGLARPQEARALQNWLCRGGRNGAVPHSL